VIINPEEHAKKVWGALVAQDIRAAARLLREYADMLPTSEEHPLDCLCDECVVWDEKARDIGRKDGRPINNP
jgi:hypothetical protein